MPTPWICGLLILRISKSFIVFRQPLSRSMYIGRRCDSNIFKIKKSVYYKFSDHSFWPSIRLNILFINIKRNIFGRSIQWIQVSFVQPSYLITQISYNQDRLQSFTTLNGEFYFCLQISHLHVRRATPGSCFKLYEMHCKLF